MGFIRRMTMLAVMMGVVGLLQASKCSRTKQKLLKDVAIQRAKRATPAKDFVMPKDARRTVQRCLDVPSFVFSVKERVCVESHKGYVVSMRTRYVLYPRPDCVPVITCVQVSGTGLATIEPFRNGTVPRSHPFTLIPEADKQKLSGWPNYVTINITAPGPSKGFMSTVKLLYHYRCKQKPNKNTIDYETFPWRKHGEIV